jgi:adenylosuccinate synthase
LDELDKIKICVGYQINGKRHDHIPSLAEDLECVSPIYETLPGWKSSTTDILDYDYLPPNAKDYLKQIEILCGIPISMISIGPQREKTILLEDVFATKECLR